MAFGGGSIGSAYGQIIIETNKAVANIQALRGGLNNFAQQTQSVGFALATLSKSVLGFSGVLAALPVAGVKLYADYEKQLRNVASISPEFAANFEQISDSVLDLSADTGRSATELASALYDIAQAGFEGAQGLDILTNAAKLANAGMTTAALGAEVLVGVIGSGIKDYGGGVLDATRISDLFFQTIFRGNITAEELGQQLGDNLSLATALGVSLPEVFTAYDVLTRQKVLPAEAATQINALMSAFLKPTEELQGIFESAGFANGVELLKTGYEGDTGLVAAVKFLDDVLQGDFGKIQDVSGNIRAIRGIVGLLAGDTALWNQEWAAINDSVGATDKALAEQAKSLSYIFKQFRESFKAALIENVEPIIPVLKAILNVGIDLIAMWRDMGDGIKNFISLLLPIGAVVYGVAGIMLQLLSRLYTIRTGLAFLGLGITTVLGPIGLLTIALTALATMILNNTGGIQGLIKGLGEILNLLHLFGTTRLNDDDFDTRVAAYERLGAALEDALGKKRAARIITALSEVRADTRRMFKQFERLGQATKNFFHILGGTADTKEINRFEDRLNALFGPQQGKRIFQNVNKLKSALGLLGDAMAETFGLQPWQTGFTKWVTDGIAKWGSFAEFMRQEVIPAFGDKFEAALVKATNGLTKIRQALPLVASAFEDVKTLSLGMIDNFLNGNFETAALQFRQVLDRIFGPEGFNLEPRILDLKIEAINFINDIIPNAKLFINDVLAGMGFDVAVANTGGTVGYKIGQVTLLIGSWFVDGAKDLGVKVGQFMNDLLGLGSDLTGGPTMDNPSLVKDIGRATVNIAGWTITAVKELSDELDRWLDNQIGGKAPGPRGLVAGPGAFDSPAGYRELGAVGVKILDWTITGIDTLLTKLDTWWEDNKGTFHDKVFELPELIGKAASWTVTESDATPALTSALSSWLFLFGASTLLAPLGIPGIAVSVGVITAKFLSTGLSDFVDFVLQTLVALEIVFDEDTPLPVQIWNALVTVADSFWEDVKREVRESKVLIDNYKGVELTVAGADVQDTPVDVSAFVVGLFNSIGTAISDAAKEISALGFLSGTFDVGVDIGTAIVEFIAGSLESVFAVSNMMTQFPKLAGALVAMAYALLTGVVKGIVTAISDNFMEAVSANMDEGAGSSFGMALAETLFEWLVETVKVGLAITNIATLGIPGLALELTRMLVDGILKSFTGEDIQIPMGGGGQIGFMDLDDKALGPISVHRMGIGEKIVEGIKESLSFDNLVGVGATVLAFISDVDSFIIQPILKYAGTVGDTISNAFSAIFSGGGGGIVAPKGLVAGPNAFEKVTDDDPWGLKAAIQGIIDLLNLFPGVDIPSLDAITGAFDRMMGVVNKLVGPLGWIYSKVTGLFGAVDDEDEKKREPTAAEQYDPNSLMDPITPQRSREDRELNPPNAPPPDPDVTPVGRAVDPNTIKSVDRLRNAMGLLRNNVTPVNTTFGNFQRALGLTEGPMDTFRDSLGDSGVAGKLRSFSTQFQNFGTQLPATARTIGSSFNPAIDTMKTKIAEMGPAFQTAADGIRDKFVTMQASGDTLRDKLSTAFQEARENGNLQMAAMMLRAGQFAEEMGVQGQRAGDSFRVGLAIAMFAAVQTVNNAMGFIRSAVTGFDLYNEGYFIGNSLGLGVARGINDSIAGVQAAAANLVLAANAAQVAAAKAKSPSELTRWTGRMLGLGVAAGITDMIPAVEAASQDAIYAALGTANGAITNGAAQAAFGKGPTAPVNVFVEPKVTELEDVKQVIEFFRVLPAHMATI